MQTQLQEIIQEILRAEVQNPELYKTRRKLENLLSEYIKHGDALRITKKPTPTCTRCNLDFDELMPLYQHLVHYHKVPEDEAETEAAASELQFERDFADLQRLTTEYTDAYIIIPER